MKNFTEYLKKSHVVLQCGAVGTELMKRGGDTPGGLSTLTCPDLVLTIQKEYVEVGAEILLTSTFSMNEIYAKQHVPGCSWQQINEVGVEIAKEAAQDKAYVLGNLGPTGQLLPPAGALAVADAKEAFRKQAAILAKGGVDGFSVQTFYDLEELEAAVAGIRSVSDLPIVASMVLENHGATFMGHTLKQAYDKLKPWGIEALGHNCGSIDFYTLGDLLSPLVAEFDLPILACPNAGLPKTKNGQTYYDMTATEFASGLEYLKGKGVKILGGCCGTDRFHIAAAAALIKH